MASSLLKVELISREMIKPSSPTLEHLKTLKLSLLDQLQPPVHMPFIFFYPNNPFSSTLLKKSLSNTLVHFYPLAGRLEGNESIICNDEGVEYTETHVSNNLLEVLENPKLIDDLRRLLPLGSSNEEYKSKVLLVQVNRFSCGGIAISVCLSHKIVDGKAFFDFVNAWATMTRALVHGGGGGGGGTVLVARPKFDSSSRFPPILDHDLDRMMYNLDNVATHDHKEKKIVTRRIIFDKKMLEELKREYISHDKMMNNKGPSRVEVVSAFIWKSVMEASRANPGLDRPVTILAAQTVNLRNRMSPPIPEESIGNFFWFTLAPPPLDNTKYSKLVGELREAIKKIDNDFIKTLQSGEFLVELKKGIESSSKNMQEGIVLETCNFTSCCGFPTYELNFGWGKPILVSPAISPTKNMVFLLTSSCGQGIEAWVYMLEDDFALLQRDHHLLSKELASPSCRPAFPFTTSKI